ncbi:MAG TPA: hypothetical protein DHV36_23310 [Desulfobacteraceae bacterium]|nr:hypothetical protein [Desulfobacteraceae bacterium]
MTHKIDNHFPTPAPAPFIGWQIVLSASLILFVSSGIGFYSHSLILDPLMKAHGWSKGTVSAAITLFFFSNGITGAIIGRWIDRYGPKWFLVSGALVFSTGLYALTRINSVPLLFLAYLIMSTGFCATALIPANTLITNWFIRRRGFAMSIANTGLSAGGVILVPLISFLILRMGLTTALLVLGGLYIAIICPIALLGIVHRPADINQFPDGLPPDAPMAETDDACGHGPGRSWTRGQAMKTLAFWTIALAFMLALAGQIAYLIHQVSFLSQYLSPANAAAAVSITAGASIAGRLLLGLFVDRWNNRYVTICCVLFQGTAVTVLAFHHHVFILYLCTLVFGLTMGPLIMMQSLLTAECFGMPSFATVSGTIGLITMPGAAFGPVIAGMIFDLTQSYQWSFLLFAGASFLSAAIVWFARPPETMY